MILSHGICMVPTAEDTSSSWSSPWKTFSSMRWFWCPSGCPTELPRTCYTSWLVRGSARVFCSFSIKAGGWPRLSLAETGFGVVWCMVMEREERERERGPNSFSFFDDILRYLDKVLVAFHLAPPKKVSFFQMFFQLWLFMFVAKVLQGGLVIC